MILKGVAAQGNSLKRGCAYVKDIGGSEGKSFSAIANTRSLDRDREVVLPEGVMIDAFMKNPVMLDIHNYRSHSVGKVNNIKLGKEILFDFEFANTEEGKKLQYLYSEKFQSAFSVGFIPKEYIIVDDKTPDQFEVDINGVNVPVNLKDYDETPRAIITKWELLEISPVPVPSNPDALLLTAKSTLLEGVESDALKSIVGARFEQIKTASIITSDAGLAQLMKGVVPSHTSKSNLELEWDANIAKAFVAKYASSDGTGVKSTIDWAKFAEGFAYFESRNADAYSSYHLLHHSADSEGVVLVPKGLYEATATLLGANNPVPEGEVAEVYKHLEGHYKDLELECPPLGTYDESQIKEILAGTFKTDKPTGEGSTETTAPTDVIKAISDMEDGIQLRLTILSEELKELRTAINGSQKQTPEEPWLEDGKALLAELEELKGVFKAQ